MRRPGLPLLGTAAEIAKNAYSEGDLKILFMKAGLTEYMPDGWYGKAQLVSGTIESALRVEQDEDRGPSTEARTSLTEFIKLVARRVAPPDPDLDDEKGSPFLRLREAARAEGLDLTVDYEVSGDSPWDRSVSVVDVRLLPVDEPRAPMSEAITALELEFDRLGMSTALNCYRQAVANLVDQRFESCNGQLRAMMEAVLVDVAKQHGFASTKQGAGGQAVTYLIDNGHLPEKEGGEFIRGLWSITHTNGPHPGTSDAGEAFFRLQSLTAAARYLLDRLATGAR